MREKFNLVNKLRLFKELESHITIEYTTQFQKHHDLFQNIFFLDYVQDVKRRKSIPNAKDVCTLSHLQSLLMLSTHPST